MRIGNLCNPVTPTISAAARVIEDLQYQQERDAMRIGNLCNPATPTISAAAQQLSTEDALQQMNQYHATVEDEQQTPPSWEIEDSDGHHHRGRLKTPTMMTTSARPSGQKACDTASGNRYALPNFMRHCPWGTPPSTKALVAYC